MPRVWFEDRMDPSPLLRRRVAIIGYGSQGRAQALNLRDSGVSVTVGLRARSAHRRVVKADRLPCLAPAEAAARADLVMLLVPDEVQGDLFPGIDRAMKPGAVLGFSHGFAVEFGLIRPGRREFMLVAPKGPGALLRRRYLEGSGIPALIGAEPRGSRNIRRLALAYARALGCGRAGVVESSFREEAVIDLFGEQAVLTGGMAELARAAFDTLVSRGYPPEIAYIECVQEVRGLAELIFEEGIAGMRERISSPAAWGGIRGGRRVIGRDTRRRLETLLDEIESGGTVRWLRRLTPERKRMLRARDREHAVEKAGRWVRAHLSWTGGGGGGPAYNREGARRRAVPPRARRSKRA